MVGVNHQPPLDWTLLLGVLVMSLGWKSMPRGDPNLATTSVTAVHTRIWRRDAGTMQGIVGVAVTLFQKLIILIPGHDLTFAMIRELDGSPVEP